MTKNLSIKKIIKYHQRTHLSIRAIAKACNSSYGTTQRIINEFKNSKDRIIQKKQLLDFNEELSLEASINVRKELPNFQEINEYLKKGYNYQQVWEMYKSKYPNGYGYSRFCELCNTHFKKNKIGERFETFPAESLQVDYCGMTMPLNDGKKAEILVGVLPYSNYISVVAINSQKVVDIIEGHIELFQFYEVLPNIIIMDNAKNMVIENSKKRLLLNETYSDLLDHYDILPVPARPRKPQDKSQVELAVKTVQQRILLPLREFKFNDIKHLNLAIQNELDKVNKRIRKGEELNPYEKFIKFEKDNMHQLPLKKYSYRTRTSVIVRDSYIQLENKFYSVPYQYNQLKVEVWHSKDSVWIYHNGEQISFWIKSENKKIFTNKEHLPKEKQIWLEDLDINNLKVRAKVIGDKTYKFVEEFINTNGITPKSQIRLNSIIYKVESGQYENFNENAEYLITRKIFDKAKIEQICRRNRNMDINDEIETFGEHKNLRYFNNNLKE